MSDTFEFDMNDQQIIFDSKTNNLFEGLNHTLIIDMSLAEQAKDVIVIINKKEHHFTKKQFEKLIRENS